MSREEVVEQVRSAFADVPAPADPAERDEAALDDCGIHLLSAEAVRYHFPRIVARALAPDEVRRGDADAFASLIFLLRGINRDHSCWQVGLFNDAQREAVLALLRFLKGKQQYLDWQSLKLVDRAIPLWEQLR